MMQCLAAHGRQQQQQQPMRTGQHYHSLPHSHQQQPQQVVGVVPRQMKRTASLQAVTLAVKSLLQLAGTAASPELASVLKQQLLQQVRGAAAAAKARGAPFSVAAAVQALLPGLQAAVLAACGDQAQAAAAAAAGGGRAAAVAVTQQQYQQRSPPAGSAAAYAAAPAHVTRPPYVQAAAAASSAAAVYCPPPLHTDSLGSCGAVAAAMAAAGAQFEGDSGSQLPVLPEQVNSPTPAAAALAAVDACHTEPFTGRHCSAATANAPGVSAAVAASQQLLAAAVVAASSSQLLATVAVESALSAAAVEAQLRLRAPPVVRADSRQRLSYLSDAVLPDIDTLLQTKLASAWSRQLQV
jgi:hypothetical protein